MKQCPCGNNATHLVCDDCWKATPGDLRRQYHYGATSLRREQAGQKILELAASRKTEAREFIRETLASLSRLTVEQLTSLSALVTNELEKRKP